MRSPPARPRSAWAGRCCSRSRARCRRPRATSWRASGLRGSSWWADPASVGDAVLAELQSFTSQAVDRVAGRGPVRDGGGDLQRLLRCVASRSISPPAPTIPMRWRPCRAPAAPARRCCSSGDRVVPAPVTAELIAHLATAHLDRRRHGRHRRRRPAVHHVPARKAVRPTALAMAALLVAATAACTAQAPVPTSPAPTATTSPTATASPIATPRRRRAAPDAIGHRAPGRGRTLRRGDDHDRHARLAPAGRRAGPARDGADRRGSGGRAW